AVVPLAHQMIQQYPELLQAFNQKKQADKAFAEDEEQQMRFFYERSPFYDQQYLKYPVLFELKP
ncbi:MAG: peptidase M14, partial [Gammaproteobacteria bacterium CG22_combo_CG10-13_8_21_14_all_40_8]